MVRPRIDDMLGFASFMDSLRPLRRGTGALPMCDERDDDWDRDRLWLSWLVPAGLFSSDDESIGGSRFSAPKLRWPNIACGWKLWGEVPDGRSITAC